jgi:uncharacterized phage infection (PIP) family protein YhgE
VTKFAVPALVFLVFALFYVSVTSPPPPDEPALEAPSAATTPTAQKLPDAVEPKPVRETRPAEAVDSVRAEVKALSDDLKRLSDETRANSDRIAQAAALRSDLQASQTSNDRTAQTMADQVEALRSDQAKLIQSAKETGDKAAQDLRQEIAAAQARLTAQLGETSKANTARAEALSQRVDAVKKDLDEIKKTSAEDRQNMSNVSPGLALVVALAALVLGPLVARQLTANQLAAAKRQAEAEAESRRSAKATGDDPPLAPSVAAYPQQDTLHDHDAPSTGGEVVPDGETHPHRRDTTNPEKV